jgi:hypothetical protein
MPSQTINVFVSYSHADGPLVAPVVRLLRVNKSLVFQDTDGIAPGTKWRDTIAKALSESNLVVVFWCDHAFDRTWCHRSGEPQLSKGKTCFPSCSMETPLPSELSEFQWIDFRQRSARLITRSRSATWMSRCAPKTASDLARCFWCLGRCGCDADQYLDAGSSRLQLYSDSSGVQRLLQERPRS